MHDDSVRRAAWAELRRREGQAQIKRDCEADLVEFIRAFWHSVEPEKPYSHSWVIEAVADLLMSVTDGHNKRALINVFPGASKSLMLNVFWPAWEWGPRKLPHMRYISTSYTSALTERDNARFLRVITDPLYRRFWPHVVVAKDGVGEVSNDKTGSKIATSVGGKMTGLRGNRVLIDDANNPNDVESPLVRESTNLWLREVMPDRLNSLEDDAIISIQQRVHEEDATGTLAKFGKNYVWMSIPAEFDPLRISKVPLAYDADGNVTDLWIDPRALDADGNMLAGLYRNARGNWEVAHGSPMAQADGALAWPERFGPEVLDEQRKIKGWAYAGQYNQIMSPRGGGIIRRDWWQVWDKPDFPPLGTIVASLDTAYEVKEEADYNALTVWGAFAGEGGAPNFILIDAWRGRCKIAELVHTIAEICTRRRVDYLLIEHKSRGRDVNDELLRLFAGQAWQVVLVKVDGDKMSRLQHITGLFSGDMRKDPVTGLTYYTGGIIWAPATVWADEVIDEVSIFPRGAHDDRVDTVSQAIGWMRKNGVALRRQEYDEIEEERLRYQKPIRVPYTID